MYDSPWPGFRVPLACICDNGSVAGAGAVTLRSGGAALELELVVSRWRSREDSRDVFFTAQWTPRPAPATTPCAARRRLRPPGRRVDLAYPYE